MRLAASILIPESRARRLVKPGFETMYVLIVIKCRLECNLATEVHSAML